MAVLTPIERETLQVFYIFHRCSMCPPLVIRQNLCDSPSRSTRVSAYHGRPEPQKWWYGCKNLEISREWRHKECPSQTPIRKRRTGLNPGTGVATTLTRRLLFLCILSTFVASFNSDTLAHLCSEPESRLVERCKHYRLHSTVASASFLTCFMDLWITLYIPWIQKFGESDHRMWNK